MAIRRIPSGLSILIAIMQDRVRAKQARQPFLDNTKVQEAGRFHMAIPESLRPKMGHLLPSQQRVYEDFARIPRNPMAAAKQVDQACSCSTSPPPPLYFSPCTTNAE